MPRGGAVSLVRSAACWGDEALGGPVPAFHGCHSLALQAAWAVAVLAAQLLWPHQQSRCPKPGILLAPRCIGPAPVNASMRPLGSWQHRLCSWCSPAALPPGASPTRQGLRLFVEYSNEIWNWIFTQTQYASRMAALGGVQGGDRHLRWKARRSVQIFDIFYEAGADVALWC